MCVFVTMSKHLLEQDCDDPTLFLLTFFAAAIRFNDRLLQQFQAFYARDDTWSLGICNGCQLMALLGWVPASNEKALPDTQQPRFVHNKSGRFESRCEQEG